MVGGDTRNQRRSLWHSQNAHALALNRSWPALAGSTLFQNSPVIDQDGNLYLCLGDPANQLVSLEPVALALRWTRTFSAPPIGSPTLSANSQLLFLVVNSTLYSLQSISGQIADLLELGCVAQSGIIPDRNGTLYLACSQASTGVISVRPDSGGLLQLRWQSSLPSITTAAPALSVDQAMLVLPVYGVLMAVWTSNGSLADARFQNFTVGLPIGAAPLILSDGRVFFLDYSGTGWMLAPNGSQLWSVLLTTAAFEHGASLSADEQILYLPQNGPTLGFGHLHALSTNNGSFLWTANLAQQVASPSSPLVDSQGAVYVGLRTAGVSVFDGSTGSPLWSYDPSSWLGPSAASGVYSSPVLDNRGMLWFTTASGVLMGLGDPSGATLAPASPSTSPSTTSTSTSTRTTTTKTTTTTSTAITTATHTITTATHTTISTTMTTSTPVPSSSSSSSSRTTTTSTSTTGTIPIEFTPTAAALSTAPLGGTGSSGSLARGLGLGLGLALAAVLVLALLAALVIRRLRRRRRDSVFLRYTREMEPPAANQGQRANPPDVPADQKSVPTTAVSGVLLMPPVAYANRPPATGSDRQLLPAPAFYANRPSSLLQFPPSSAAASASASASTSARPVASDSALPAATTTTNGSALNLLFSRPQPLNTQSKASASASGLLSPSRPTDSHQPTGTGSAVHYANVPVSAAPVARKTPSVSGAPIPPSPPVLYANRPSI